MIRVVMGSLGTWSDDMTGIDSVVIRGDKAVRGDWGVTRRLWCDKVVMGWFPMLEW